LVRDSFRADCGSWTLPRPGPDPGRASPRHDRCRMAHRGSDGADLPPHRQLVERAIRPL